MTELKFFTDGDKVYLNMDNGITKEVDLSSITGGSGGSGGGDGGDVFVVNYIIDTNAIDKTYKEIKEAVASGKVVMLTRIVSDSELVFIESEFYLTDISHQNPDSYVVTFSSAFYDDLSQKPALSLYVFEATTDTGTLEKIYPIPH